MNTLRQRALQRAGTVLTLALILVSLAFSGHRHTTGQPNTSDSCPVCVATHHSPAVSAAPVLQPAPALRQLAVAAPPVLAPSNAYRPYKSGRSPPLQSTTHVA